MLHKKVLLLNPLVRKHFVQSTYRYLLKSCNNCFDRYVAQHVREETLRKVKR